PRCIRRVPSSMNTRTYSLLRSTVSACRKAGREDPRSLGVQELPPGRARAARRWIEARSVQDLPDNGRGDRHGELGQFAVDAAVSPTADSLSPGGRRSG